MSSKIDKATKRRLAEIENMIKPKHKVYVWHVRGEYYYNDDGEKFKREDLPRGENVLNIIIDVV